MYQPHKHALILAFKSNKELINNLPKLAEVTGLNLNFLEVNLIEVERVFKSLEL